MIRIPLRLFAALALVALIRCSSSLVVQATRTRATRPARPKAARPPRARRAASSSSSVPLTSTSSTPARPTTPAGFQVIYATQTPLYIPKPPIGDAEPGLAEGKPEISDDKKSVTVTLKKGVKFAPPVEPRDPGEGHQVRLRARVHQERPEPVHDVLQLHRGRPGEARCPQGHLRASSSTAIRTRSRSSSPRRRRPGFANFLVMPVTTPVPQEYAEKFDKESPSTYNENVVSSGPYMVENDASGQARRLQGRQVDRPRPQPELGREQGHPPRVPRRDPLRTNATDANVSGRQVLSG